MFLGRGKRLVLFRVGENMPTGGDRVQIIIETAGHQGAFANLQNLKRAVDQLKGTKITLQLDAAHIKSQIRDVERQIEHLRELRLSGNFTADMQEDLTALQDRLEGLRRELRDLNADIQLDTAIIRSGTHDLHEMEEQARRVSDAFNAIAGILDGLASGIGGLNKFSDSITSAFGKMSDIFSTNITDNLSKSFADMLAQNMVGSFQSAIQRYDILHTFEQYMQLAGVSSSGANAALSRVNQSILGLPIGLDEAAQRLRRYQMFLGDVDKATNLTIGIQNALFAGGASNQMRNQAFIMIDRLLSAGRLSTSRQWLSLIQGLGVSMRYLSEEMGVTVTDVKEFAAGLTSGAISTEDFLGALMRLGEGSSEAAKKLNNALEVYKTTLESWIMNIQFAFTRGTANLMDAVDKSLERVGGAGITGYLSRFRGAVNSFYASGVEVVGDDERISRFAGAIERLLDALGRFDGQLIAGGIIDNLSRVIDMFAQGLRRLPVGETEAFIAFATTLAGPLAKLFTTISSGLPVMLGVFQRFKDFDFESLLDKLITQAGRLASAVAGLLSIIPDGIMGDLMAFALVWGRPLVSVLTGLSTALRAVGTALSTAALSTSVSNAFASGGLLAGVAKLAATHPYITAAVAAAAGIGALIKVTKSWDEEYLKRFHENALAGISSFDLKPLAANITSSANGIRDAREAFDGELGQLDTTVAKSRELVEKIRDIDQKLDGAEGAELDQLTAKRNVYMQQLGEISDEFVDALNAESLALDGNKDAHERNVDAVIEAWERRARLGYYEERIGQITREQISLEDQKNKLDAESDRIRAELEDVRARRQARWDEVGQGWHNAYEGRTRAPISFGRGPNTYAGWSEEIKTFDIQIEALEGRLVSTIPLYYKLGRALKSLGVESDDIAQIMVDLGLATEDSASEMVDALESVNEELQKLHESYKQLRDGIAETIKATATGFAAFKAPKTQKAQDTINNLNARKAFADQLAEDLGLVIDAIMDNPDMFPDKTMAAEFIEKLVGNPEENAGIINGIAENIRQGKPQWADNVAKAYVESMTSAMNATNKTDFALALAAGLKNGISAINWEDYSLTEEQAAEIIRTVMGFRDGDVVDIPVRFRFTPGEAEGGLDDLLDEEGNLLDTYTAHQRLKTQRLEKEIDKAQGAVEKTVEQIIQGVDGINKSLKNISDDGLKTIEAAANRAADQLSHVSDAVEGIGTAIDNRSGTMDNFASILDSIGDEANHASSEIYRLRDAILSLEDKEVNITVNKNEVGGTVRGNPNGPVDAKFATGGPSGTDTISAWLTPGEYVMRKGAVDKLGQSFLSRLNSLDFKGAIDSMMHQYYRAPSMQTMASYTNNSYDNRNITVNQNVSTNNPDYAGRRIVSRYARALRG